MDEKYYSLSQLLKMNNCGLSSLEVFRALDLLGYTENVEYVSSSGSGEIKKYRQFTNKGLEFGINKSGFNPSSKKTECKFNETNFNILLLEVTEYLNEKNSDSLDDVLGKYCDQKRSELRISITAK